MFFEEKKEGTPIGKMEWEAIKKLGVNKEVYNRLRSKKAKKKSNGFFF